MRACAACGQPVPIRYRNPDRLPPTTAHVAGDVIDGREYRRGCPTGYIVDRRQACSRCGRQLIRGRWALFFEPGACVLEVGDIAAVLVEGHDPTAGPCG